MRRSSHQSHDPDERPIEGETDAGGEGKSAGRGRGGRGKTVKGSPAGRLATLVLFGLLWNGIVVLAYLQMLRQLIAGNGFALLVLLFLTPFVGVGIGQSIVPLVLLGLGKLGVRPFGFSYSLDENPSRSGSSIAFWGGAFQLGMGAWLMTTTLAPLLFGWWQMRSWQPTPCDVLSCALKEADPGGVRVFHTAQVRYRYLAGGREMIGDRYAIRPTLIASRKAVEKLRSLLRPGVEPFCFVDPRHPENAVLTRDIRGSRMTYGGFGALLFFVGAIALGIGSRGWVKANRPASNALERPERILFWLLLLIGWGAFGTAMIIGDICDREWEVANVLEMRAQTSGIGMPDPGVALFFGVTALAILARLLYHVFVKWDRVANEMGHTPMKIGPASQRGRALYYAGKDAAGNERTGVIRGTPLEAMKNLEAMGLRDVTISHSKNLDVSFDDTTADKFAKGIAKLLFFVVLGATFVFLKTFPGYFSARHLEGAQSLVVNARITQIEPNLIEYTYEADGAQYARWAPAPRTWAEAPRKGATVPVRYSIRHPSISRLDGEPAPENVLPPRAAPIAGIVLAAAVLLLFYASAFHYVARIWRARSAGNPAPPNDVKRLLTNAANSIMFPLIFGCMIGAFLGQDNVSFYHPWRFHFAGGSIVLLAAAIYLWRKGPIYYD